ncbi:MAG: hypothetical protein WBB45_19505 [Cyclobacteriaceae bacterium]
MSVKKTSFSKKFSAVLDTVAMSQISGGVAGDPFDPYFSDRRRAEKSPKKIEESAQNSFRRTFIVG